MQGNRAVRRDLKVLQRHASRFAADVNRLGDHLAHTEQDTTTASPKQETSGWRAVSRTTGENLRSLVMQARSQMGVLSEQTKRQARAIDVRMRKQPYQFVTGSLIAGIATGTLLGLVFKRK
jgi:ElaB/YqjD/DUF883 family membrane-anchored ribosome-binding protein